MSRFGSVCCRQRVRYALSVISRYLGLGVLLIVAACGARSGLELQEEVDADALDAGAESDIALADTQAMDSTVGECSEGLGPRELGRGTSGAFHVATDGEFAYWNDDTRILSVPICGGPVTVLAEDQRRPFYVATDGQFVYWTSANGNGNVSRVPRGGGRPEVILDVEGQPEGLALRAGWLYLTVVAGTDRGVWRIRDDGSSAEPLFLSERLSRRIAVDDEAAYVSTDEGIWRISTSGSGEALLLTTRVTFGTIAVDAEFVYWTDWSGPEPRDHVSRAPKMGGPVEVLHRGAGGPVVGLAVDRTHVYWTQENVGTVWGKPLSGGPEVAIATGQPVLENIVVFEDGLLWVNFQDASLWRAPLL